MSVRHPSSSQQPSRSRQSARVVKYQEPPISPFRRVTRLIFRPSVIIGLIFLTTLTLSVFGYYYTVFSARIDKLLRGEIFTRSAGIYAAPKELRVGANSSAESLVARLKRAGYVEKSQQADASRGRYRVDAAGNLEVEPGQSAIVDGQRLFPRLRIRFARGGKSVSSINELDGNRKLDNALMETELISSVMGQARERRKVIGFGDLPPHLVKAITVTEDRTFFTHHGINVRGILRALLRRYDADAASPIARQGGSSITQQLVKNLLLSPEKTIRRKIAEAYMSVILETRLSKEEIFALYCNEAYLGQRAGFSINGFGEAAESYFNKDVTSLTLPEAALLAGMIRSPNRYNPYRHSDTAISRRNQVVQSMMAAGVITQLEAARSQAAELKLAPAKGRDASDAPYFVDYVQNQLGEMFADGSATQHLRIYTTVDMDLQRAAYAAVTNQLAALDKIYAKRIAPGTLQAALVAMNAQTGEVIAMVGGRDYEQSQFNRATDAMRQPGSVFKPFVYAAALNTAYDPIPRVITAATTYTDEPKTFTFNNQQYAPGNFGDQYSNAPVTLRDALVKSLNVVTVEVADEITIGRVMNLASRAGLPKPPRPYLAMALGSNEATPLQIASAYTAFAANGTRTTPVAIRHVTTGNGNTVLIPSGQKEQVLRPEVAYLMTSFMKDVVDRGTAVRLRGRGFRHNVAGKTGTSRDGWFAGYTPNIVCAVYVGFDDGSQLGLTGADSALPIWSNFMTAALAAHPEWGGDWQMPAGIQQAVVDPQTGLLAAVDSLNKRVELFIGGTAPTVVSEAPLTDEEPLLDGEATGTDGEGYDYEPAPLPSLPRPPQSPTLPDIDPRTRNAPRLEGESIRQPDGSTRLMGTVTLDVDSTTGLIATESCPVVRSRSFPIGQQPNRYCGPQYHASSGTTTTPPSSPVSRPRVVVPR